jgi:hypothetical protein
VGAEVAFALLGGTLAECLERGFARRVAVKGSRGMPCVTEQEGVVGWWGVAAGELGPGKGLALESTFFWVGMQAWS